MAWASVGNVFYLGCQALVFVAIARMGDARNAGIYAFGMALHRPFVQLTGLALSALIATDANRTHPFQDYWRVRLIGGFSGFAIAIPASIVLAPSRAESLAVLLLLVTKTVDALAEIDYGALHREERLDLRTRCLIINGVLSVALTTLLLAVTDSILLAIVGSFGASLVTAIVARKLRLSAAGGGEPLAIGWSQWWRERHATPLVRLGFPLGIVALCMGAIDALAIWYVRRHVGAEAVGHFAAATYLVVAVQPLTASVGMAWAPKVTQSLKAGQALHIRKSLRRLYTLGLGTVALVCVVAAVLGPATLGLLFGAEYREAGGPVMGWIGATAALGVVTSTAGWTLTALRSVRLQLLLYGIAVFIALGLGAVLVPERGIEGAAITILVAVAVPTIGMATASWRLVKGPYTRA